MADRALEGVIVIELASSPGAAYCAKLLGDLGARVVLVEPPGGHPLRREGPTRDGAAHTGLFAYLGLNKESVALSAESEADWGTLRELIARADILVTDGEGAVEWEAGSLAPQQLITVDVSAFGRSGRYASWKSSELTDWALGGYMYFTGEKAREPLMLPGRQAEWHAGAQAAMAALAALHEQRTSGFGQEIEVSAVEAVLSAHSWLSVAWSHAGMLLDRSTHDFVRCSDGWVCFMRQVAYQNLFLMIDRPEMMSDPRWSTALGWAANAKEIYEAVGEWCKVHTRKEVVDAAQDLRIACAPVNDPRDLSESAQLEARGWWVDVEDRALGKVRLPGFPYQMTETPATVTRPAPLPGQHAGAIAELVATPKRPNHAGAAPTRGPLTGIRVVEVTSNWAGPVCGRHFGDLGADVIKVEGPSRPATRGAYWPNNDPQRQGYNRAGYFNQMNRNKRDVVLDLASEAGKAAFIELAKSADVVIENNSARVMPNLGLDFEALRRVNPALIMVSISGSGGTGPERDYVAFGSTVEASCGLASQVGYDDSQPYRTGFYYADPVAGVHAAVAALAALETRRRTGRGQWIDVSLNESAACFFPEALIDYQLSGVVRGRIGNRDPRFTPQGAYRCAGIDNWLALSVETDEDWRALCEVVGYGVPGKDGVPCTPDERHARQDEIDQVISAWTSGLEQYEAAWALQRVGVAAAPVLANWQLLCDPHLSERGFYVPIEHPVVGVYPFPSWPWRFSRTPAQVTRHAPLFGEHNREVLREVGMTDDAITSLYESQVMTDEPISSPF